MKKTCQKGLKKQIIFQFSKNKKKTFQIKIDTNHEALECVQIVGATFQ